MSPTPDTLVTAVEVQRSWTRLTPLRKTGTLRFEMGHVTFEGSDGRRRFRVPAEQVTDVVRHRGGFGFWLTFDGRRYFVVPRTKPRPAGFNLLYALVRPLTTMRYLWWSVRYRRRGRALTHRWLEILTPSARVAGLPAVVRVPIRVALVSCIVLPVPATQILSQMG
jgi:hypothetical protein